MGEARDYEAMCQSSLGVELKDDECRALTDIMGVRNLRDGDVLVKEGSLDRTLHVLTSGKLAVASMVGDKEVVRYTMKEGECAGTRAFVDGTQRKATVRAVGDATVYTLEPEAFEALLETHPRIVYKVMRAIFRTAHANLMRMNLESAELSKYITKTGGRY